MSTINPYLTRKEIAAIFCISVNSLLRRAKELEIESCRVNGSKRPVLYRRIEILKIAKNAGYTP